MSRAVRASAQVSPMTAALATYVSRRGVDELPEPVRARTRLHILDTIAAIVSGSCLLPGVRALEWAARQPPWTGAAATIAGGGRTAPFVAALCNGIAAHADETDDSHMDSLSHPGCAVVPAALAAAEAADADGETLLRAVIVGYDVGCRVGRATGLGKHDGPRGKRDSHSLVGGFGAAAAAALVHCLSEEEVRYAFSYAAQQSSGTTTYPRDRHHVEKAYLFGGKPASEGVLAVDLVRSGFDGVADVFVGTPNWVDAVSPNPERQWLDWELGVEFEVMRTTLKKYAVGSPAQAAVEAAMLLIREAGIRAADIDAVRIDLPSDNWAVVNNRTMPDINVQYLVAGTFLDGSFTFEMAHDRERMRHPSVASLLARTVLGPESDFKGTRSARVTVSTGRREETRTVTEVSGRPTRPMSAREVRAKAEDLMRPLGAERAAAICEAVLAVDGLPHVRRLTALLELPRGNK